MFWFSGVSLLPVDGKDLTLASMSFSVGCMHCQVRSKLLEKTRMSGHQKRCMFRADRDSAHDPSVTSRCMISTGDSKRRSRLWVVGERATACNCLTPFARKQSNHVDLPFGNHAIDM